MELYKIYTLEEMIAWNNDYSKMLIKKMKLDKDIKSKIRHKVINYKEDLDTDTLALLLLIKEKLFNNNPIYLAGSRINGKYITEEEYNLYIQDYPDIKVSDYDIKSIYKPNITKVKEFEKEYHVKIDYSYGTYKIEI